jgi:hypothetical protein
MDASGWAYFTPYQPDINKALQDLRQKEFEAGSYHFPVELHLSVEEYESMSKEALDARIAELKEIQERPRSIQELLRINADAGTHSIIDIESISDVPDFGTAAPLSEQQLLRLFNTEKPTRPMIEAKADELEGLRYRWQGTYVIVYKDGRPDEIYFTGFSGD